MYAQVTTIEWPPGEKVEGMNEALQTVRDQIVPFAQQQHGFKGFLGLSQDGKLILQTLWETEADLKASETNGYCRLQQDKLVAFLPQRSTTLLWCQAYEIFDIVSLAKG
jgi:hypothetical protein